MKTNYTTEELKEKILSNIDKEAAKAGLPSLSSIISKDLDELLPLIDNAYQELIKEKLSLLSRFDPSGICDNPVVDWMEKVNDGDYIKVEDIEELFNIKL